MTAEIESVPVAEDYAGVYVTWWHRLTNSEHCRVKKWPPLPTAHKAVLRRCTSLDEVLLSEPFQNLWLSLPDEKRTQRRMPLVALLAWALAHVRKDSEKGLAQAMAEPKNPESKAPRVTQLRFQQLINARNLEDFNRRLRRILQQIDGAVSVRSFVREIENWYWQSQSDMPEPLPERRQVLKWAMSYYQTIPNSKS